METKPEDRNKSAAWKKGYAVAHKVLYWEWQIERDAARFRTEAARAEFWAGYHDGLADKYSMPRPRRKGGAS